MNSYRLAIICAILKLALTTDGLERIDGGDYGGGGVGDADGGLQRRVAHVRTILPDFVEFTFDATDNFTPLALYAHLERFNSRRPTFGFWRTVSGRNVGFKNFKNSVVIRVYDKMVASLYYMDGGKERVRTATLKYTVANKPADSIFFFIEQPELAGTTPNTISTPSTMPSPSSVPTTVVVPTPMTIEDPKQRPAYADDEVSSVTTLTTLPTQSTDSLEEYDDLCTCSSVANEYQTELIATALAIGKFHTRLLLKRLDATPSPWLDDAVEMIREFITGTLRLPQLRYNILQAAFNDEGLLFEMRDARSVLEIMTQARLLLHGSRRFRIESTEREFIEVSQMARMGDVY